MIQIDPDVLLAAVADRIADRVLGQPGGDFDVRVSLAVKQAIDDLVHERVAAMIDRLLVERASETFAACDGAVEMVRAETMRAARERVAQTLPSKDEVKRESLAVIRDAVMVAFAPAVERVAAFAGEIRVDVAPVEESPLPPDGCEWLPPVPHGADPNKPPWNGRHLDGPPMQRNGRPVKLLASTPSDVFPMPTPAIPQPCRGKGVGCTCDDCIPF